MLEERRAGFHLHRDGTSGRKPFRVNKFQLAVDTYVTCIGFTPDQSSYRGIVLDCSNTPPLLGIGVSRLRQLHYALPRNEVRYKSSIVAISSAVSSSNSFSRPL